MLFPDTLFTLGKVTLLYAVVSCATVARHFCRRVACNNYSIT